MPMSKDKQLAKIARAKVLAESNPLIPTLTACCAEAGFKATDRAAISNKDAINEIRFIFDQRKMVREYSHDTCVDRASVAAMHTTGRNMILH